MKKLTIIAVSLFILVINPSAVMSYPCNCHTYNGIEVCQECTPPDATSVPEPSTLVLLGIGLAGLLARKVYVNRRK